MCYSAITEVNIPITFKNSHKMWSVKIRAVWLCHLYKIEGNYFLSEYVPPVHTSHSTYIPRQGAVVTVFKLCINPQNSVLCVSSKVTLLPFFSLLSILSHCVRKHVSTRLFIRLSKFNNILCAKWQKPLLGIRFPHLLDVFIPHSKPLIYIVISTCNSLYKAHLLWEISALSVSLNTYDWPLLWHHEPADVLIYYLSLYSTHFIFSYSHFIISTFL